ncbi:cyclase family protein [soil metagenome]
MLALIETPTGQVRVNLSEPLDISMPLRSGVKGANAWWAQPFSAEPVVMGDFVGSVARGGAVNFVDVRLNPHGNGTHTECVGHISTEPYTINQTLKQFFFLAELISIFPVKVENGDCIIFKEQIEKRLNGKRPEALVLRTLPNDGLKKIAQYSGKNPPYLHHDALDYLARIGVKHFLLDLPSVDREEDGGKLLGHRAFWRYPGPNVREHATITELIYVDGAILDGSYLLNLQIASFEIDASPSKPVLYKIG